jgi:transposase
MRVVAHTRGMAERVQVGEITNDEGNRLLRIVRRSSGSVVTWRRAQMVLLSAQHMDVIRIAEVTFTSPDRVREVIHNFNVDGFDSLYPRYWGGRPPTFTLPQRRQMKKIALSRPTDHDLPFSTWSLSKLAEFLVAEGWSTTLAGAVADQESDGSLVSHCEVPGCLGCPGTVGFVVMPARCTRRVSSSMKNNT